MNTEKKKTKTMRAAALWIFVGAIFLTLSAVPSDATSFTGGVWGAFRRLFSVQTPAEQMFVLDLWEVSERGGELRGGGIAFPITRNMPPSTVLPWQKIEKTPWNAASASVDNLKSFYLKPGAVYSYTLSASKHVALLVQGMRSVNGSFVIKFAMRAPTVRFGGQSGLTKYAVAAVGESADDLDWEKEIQRKLDEFNGARIRPSAPPLPPQVIFPQREHEAPNVPGTEPPPLPPVPLPPQTTPSPDPSPSPPTAPSGPRQVPISNFIPVTPDVAIFLIVPPPAIFLPGGEPPEPQEPEDEIIFGVKVRVRF